MAWYFIANLSTISTFIAFLIVSVALLFIPTSNPKQLSLDLKKSSSIYWLSLVALIDVVIVAMFLFKRTDAALISPWTLYESQPFILFGLATLIFLFNATKRKDDLPILVGILHTFAAVSVSAIVYKIGFGFDPFIHRAAENALSVSGTIEPRQILYIGQYVLVTALHHLTNLPLKQIDIWLIPLLTSLSLPICGYLGLKNGWNLSKQQAQTWWITALTSSFMVITYTIPFSFTFLFFLISLFLLPSIKSNPQKTIFLFASVVSILFHPLLAVPTTLFILAYFLQDQIKHRIERIVTWTLSTFAIATSVPAMLIVYQKSQGQTVAFNNLLERLPYFQTLFNNPFNRTSAIIPWHLNLVYNLEYILPFLIFTLALISIYFYFKKQKRLVTNYIIYVVGLFLAIFGTSTLFYFKNIIGHEQAEFALRLLNAWYLILIPFVAILFSKFSQEKRIKITLIIIVTFLIVHAWYFSYPQYNEKYPNISPSVSQTDIEIVKHINKLAEDKPYLVLSNQMTSAAALETFGFNRYISLENEKVLWYAIPTGGKLYTYYIDTIFLGPNRERFDDLLNETNVESIYFVLNNYWAWTSTFLDKMEAISDDSFQFNNNQTKIIEFSKRPL